MSSEWADGVTDRDEEMEAVHPGHLGEAAGGGLGCRLSVICQECIGDD